MSTAERSFAAIASNRKCASSSVGLATNAPRFASNATSRRGAARAARKRTAERLTPSSREKLEFIERRPGARRPLDDRGRDQLADLFRLHGRHSRKLDNARLRCWKESIE
jgi:hypothetical protein